MLHLTVRFPIWRKFRTELHHWANTAITRKFSWQQHSMVSTDTPQLTVKGGQSYGNFDLVRSFKIDYADVTVSKWRSRVTGLSIVHLDYKGEQHLFCHR